jgi:hypothetical protein
MAKANGRAAFASGEIFQTCGKLAWAVAKAELCRRETRMGQFHPKTVLGIANRALYFNMPDFGPFFSVLAAGRISAPDAGCCTGRLPGNARTVAALQEQDYARKRE